MKTFFLCVNEMKKVIIEFLSTGPVEHHVTSIATHIPPVSLHSKRLSESCLIRLSFSFPTLGYLSTGGQFLLLFVVESSREANVPIHLEFFVQGK